MSHVQFKLNIKYISEMDTYVIDVLQEDKLIKTFAGSFYDCMDEVKLFLKNRI